MKKLRLLIIVGIMIFLGGCNRKKIEIRDALNNYKLEEAKSLAQAYEGKENSLYLDYLLEIYKAGENWDQVEEIKLESLKLRMRDKSFYDSDLREAVDIYLSREDEEAAKNLIESYYRENQEKSYGNWINYYIKTGERDRAYELFIENYRNNIYGPNIENERIVQLIEALGEGMEAENLLDNYLDYKSLSSLEIEKLLEVFKENKPRTRQILEEYSRHMEGYQALELVKYLQDQEEDLELIMEGIEGLEEADKVYRDIIKYYYENLADENLEDIILSNIEDYSLEYFITKTPTSFKVYSYDLEGGKINFVLEEEGFEDYKYSNEKDFILWGRCLVIYFNNLEDEKLIYLSRNEPLEVFEIDLVDDVKISGGKISSPKLKKTINLSGYIGSRDFEIKSDGIRQVIKFYEDEGREKLLHIVIKDYRLLDTGYFEFVGLEMPYTYKEGSGNEF